MDYANLLAWITSAVTFGTVIMLGSIGETINQKAGGLNLGTPGIMMLGGMASLTGAFLYETRAANPNAFIGVLISILSTIVICGLAGFIYALLTVTLRANQNVTGLSLTILGTGAANFLGGSLMKLSGGVGQINVPITSRAIRASIPFLSEKLGFLSETIFKFGWFAYVTVILALAADWFLNKTSVGLNLRAVGENPATADAAGINVTKYKYLSFIAGGAIAGLGGMFYVMDYTKGTWANDSIIEALGWLAVALVIFTTWKPRNSIWGAYLFGLCYWLFLYVPSGINAVLLKLMKIDRSTYLQNLYQMIPYLVTVIVLILVSKKNKRENQAPGALGVSYFREER